MGNDEASSKQNDEPPSSNWRRWVSNDLVDFIIFWFGDTIGSHNNLTHEGGYAVSKVSGILPVYFDNSNINVGDTKHNSIK